MRNTACRSCGYYDYFDDMRLMLEDFGIKAGIKGI